MVANTVQHVSKNSGIPELFGSNTLPGGHAEYVRVPDADKSLVKIAASGEERAVLAGGTAGLGMALPIQLSSSAKRFVCDCRLRSDWNDCPDSLDAVGPKIELSHRGS
ncbi:MAG: hypothetical protein Ct9H300mP19_11030 [Dehalococcoidia bacterium]|nr:MAG: hypothetical protein Ct9H300mP19_11030 [Dehalococcoidia bacterium]